MNILLTSAGRRSYLVDYFVQEWKNFGLVHASNSHLDASALWHADRYVQTPTIYDVNYIEFLLTYCKEHSIKCVIPLFDVDLLVLARNKALLESNGITVLVANKDQIEICNDKWKTAEFLQKQGLEVPRTFLTPENSFSLLSECDLMIKPRWGMGSIGLYRATTELEVQVFFEKIKKEIASSYLKYESSTTPENQVIIQEFLPGKEYGLDVINNLRGELEAVIVKEKLAMRSGETDGAKVIRNEELFEMGAKLSKLIRHPGNLDVDILEKDGKFHVLELNARFGGGYPFSHLAGVNLPAAIKSWLLGNEIDKDLLIPVAGTVGYKSILPEISPLHSDI